MTTEFEEQWATGKVDGWKDEPQENGHVSEQNTAIDLEYFSTVDELVELGPEKLKEVNAYYFNLFSNFFFSPGGISFVERSYINLNCLLSLTEFSYVCTLLRITGC